MPAPLGRRQGRVGANLDPAHGLGEPVHHLIVQALALRERACPHAAGCRRKPQFTHALAQGVHLCLPDTLRRTGRAQHGQNRCGQDAAAGHVNPSAGVAGGRQRLRVRLVLRPGSRLGARLPLRTRFRLRSGFHPRPGFHLSSGLCIGLGIGIGRGQALRPLLGRVGPRLRRLFGRRRQPAVLAIDGSAVQLGTRNIDVGPAIVDGRAIEIYRCPAVFIVDGPAI